MFVVALIGIILANQGTIAPAAFAQSQAIPNFWHPTERIPRPDLTGLQRLRFLTTTDFPPFNFIDRNKRLTGFHVDLARAICDELAITPQCQIQALPWDELEEALKKGEGDAIIAGIQVTGEKRDLYHFSRPYMRIPARFVARASDGLGEPMTLAVSRHRTGLVRNSIHADWFLKAFPKAQTVTFDTRVQALDALREKDVDLVFSDALSLSFWLVSEAAEDCCVFAGGPYLTPALTGPGMMIAFPKDKGDLALATDYALKQITEKGIFAEIYLRYFPVSLF